ncbi:MAG TPA: TolC family protein [Planctomycetaceae bacterium]|nr:TolC family protein [Planctomycetaceae bacterium]
MARIRRIPWISAALLSCIAATGCHSAPWHEASIAPVATATPAVVSVTERSANRGMPSDHISSSIQQVSAETVEGNSVDESPVQQETNSAVHEITADLVDAPLQVQETNAVVAQPIDLPTALMLTAGRSPQVAFAQARIEESRAQLDRAESLWLPSLRAGANYNKHEGRIQDVAGNIIETSRGAVYSGFGANAVGAASPAVPGLLAQFHVADAVFQPRISQQTIRARDANARAATNDSLLATSLAYTQLLRVSQEKAIAEIAMGQAQELERVTGEFATAGEGLTSDHDRARAELAMKKNELQRTDEAVQVASARLAQQVRWEYAQVLQPADECLYPVSFVNGSATAQNLVAMGLSNRPEIAESRHLVCEAVERLNREKYAPLIPSVLLGVSYGGMAGGLGSNVTNGGDRLDADAVAYWELRQLGFGEKAARREASSRIVQSRMKQVAMMDQVAREIVEAHAQVLSRAQQIETSKEAVSAAQDSFRRNWERIQNGQGLPIEVLQSIQALTNAQKEYARSIADHNVAQFTLHRALGWPIDAQPGRG